MKELKSYYRQVATWLPCGGKLKKQLMANITTTIEGYRAEHPEADFSALQAHFGTPRQIAAAFVDEMETDELLNALKIRRKIMAIVTIIAITMVMLWASALTIALADELINANGYGEVVIID